MEDFEKMLSELSRPVVGELRHQEMLAEELIKQKAKQAVSFWWLLIPIFVLCMFVIKTFYRKTSLSLEIRAFHEKQPFLAAFLFIAIPILLVGFNSFKAKRNMLSIGLIILSLFILIFYLMSCYV